MAVCCGSSISIEPVLTFTATVLRGTSESSTSSEPCQSLNEPVVRKTLESPIAKSIVPCAAPICSGSAANARPAYSGGSRQAAAPSRLRRPNRGRRSDTGVLEGLEEPPAGAALVLVDRALVIGRRQRQTHRRRHDARLVGRLADHHAAVELVEIGD